MRSICPRFFAKQSAGFLVFFSADFLRLAAAVFSVCRYKGETAEHPLLRIGKKRVQGIFERLGIYSERGERAINPKSAAADV